MKMDSGLKTIKFLGPLLVIIWGYGACISNGMDDLVCEDSWVVVSEDLDEVGLQLTRKNLQTLAKLKTLPKSKIVFNSTGEIVIQPNEYLLQGLKRYWAGSSIFDKRAFSLPLEMLFRSALEHFKSDEVQWEEISDAFKGLAKLKETYSAEPKKIHEVNVVLLTISKMYRDFGTLSEFERKISPILKIREKFQKNIVYPVCQGDFLEEGESGHCLAFTIDWIRRKEKGKDSYANSKKPMVTSPIGKIVLSLNEQMRMRKKTSEIKKLQAEIDEAMINGKDQRTHTVINEVLGKRKKYREIELRERSRTYIFIDPEMKGDEIAKQILRNLRHVQSSPVILSFKGTVRAENPLVAEGHAMGIHIDPENEGIHFFDPNLGEFIFSSKEDFVSFFNEIYAFYEGDFRGISFFDYFPNN